MRKKKIEMILHDNWDSIKFGKNSKICCKFKIILKWLLLKFHVSISVNVLSKIL